MQELVSNDHAPERGFGFPAPRFPRTWLLLGALVAIVGLLPGCDSFLDLSPESQRSQADFFDTPGDFEIAVNGAYDALQLEGTYGTNYWAFNEMRSDNTDQGPQVTGGFADLANINTFDELPSNDIVEATWLASYEGVQRTNTILARIGAVDFQDASLKEQYRGEALFLRSLFYYNLAVAFGNIPLILEETSYPEVPALNQMPAQEVYSQIIGDLGTAAELLPARSEYPGGQAFRASSGAARTLLGKVLLTIGNSGEAETVLRSVVESGEYRLVDDYGSLWGPDRVENSGESIFEIQFQDGGVGEGSTYTNDFSPSPDLQTGSGTNQNRPTQDLLPAYSPGDLRFDPSLDTTYVNARGETIQARYVQKYESDPFSGGDAPNNFIVLRYADVLLMLAEAIGESDEAYDLINQVRSRASLEAIGPATEGSFQEKLLHERRVELAFENHRWPDLRRFAATNQTLDEDAVTDVRPLFPIPQRELDVAPEVLEQNPGF